MSVLIQGLGSVPETTMKIKLAPWWLWLIPILFLLIATAQLALSYYTATRIVVFGIAVFVAIVSWNDGWLDRLGSVALAIVAVIFNPLMPLPFTRETWVVLDWIGIAVFAAHLILVRLRLLQTSAK
jgi:hypothetical protein